MTISRVFIFFAALGLFAAFLAAIGLLPSSNVMAVALIAAFLFVAAHLFP